MAQVLEDQEQVQGALAAPNSPRLGDILKTSTSSPPHSRGVTAEAELPWNLRIYPDNQGSTANNLRKKYNISLFTPAVAPIPLWEQASVKLSEGPPTKEENPKR